LVEAVDVIRPLLAGHAVDVDGAHYCVRAEAGELVAPPGVSAPLLIGGNGTRVLQLAGRVADIAGLAGFSHNRDATQMRLTHFDTVGLEDRIAVVREAAGDRFDAIELNALIQFVAHTDDREAAAAELATAFDVSPEFVLDSPFVLLGTHEQMAEALGSRRQGITEVARRLQARQVIAYSRGRMSLLDRDAAERHACLCYRVVGDAYRAAEPAHAASA
jgi:probable F420-dependent oxidoreductase